MTNEALRIATSRAGSQKALAELVGVSPPSVHEWISRGIAPPDRCPAIESATGVRCEDLRPDLGWERNQDGRVTGYRVPLAMPRRDAACETATSLEQ